MTELFRFTEVGCEDGDRVYSFTLHSGETRLLQLTSNASKNVLIAMALGETGCRAGKIEIALGDKKKHSPANHLAVTWQPLGASRPGRVGWVAANGGLISNLKIWENVTLPLWYHTRHEVIETERNIVHWLGELGLEQEAHAEFMAAAPHTIELWQRKLAGLLRALVEMPLVLVVDALLFDDVGERLELRWIKALETYASKGHAVLVIADKETNLPWKKIE
jgi:phospholipid/cholesterol/gamma-HCH transport system ATP-binding protein